MCPFLEKSDARCATHLTLANLCGAFAHCADEYASCPTYRKLLAELISPNGHHHDECVAAVGLLVAS